jgi:hypothetical protein
MNLIIRNNFFLGDPLETPWTPGGRVDGEP